MIIDTLDHSSRYTLPERFNTAFEFLKNLPDNPEDGIIEIDGQNVYAVIATYETHPRETARYEAHHDYIDIQYIISGTEIIEYHHADNLPPTEPYNPEKDCVFYPAGETPAHQIRLVPGIFCIFFSGELHMPGLSHQPVTVKKVVIKVKIDS